MTSRSTVTQPAGRDVGSAYQIETPPASPQYRDVNATELEHCRQRGVNVTSGAQCGAIFPIPLSYHSRPNVVDNTCGLKEAGQNLKRYSEFDFSSYAQPAQVSVNRYRSRPGPVMYRETFCPPFAAATYGGCIDPTEEDDPYSGQNMSKMPVGQRKQQLLYEPQYVDAADPLAQIRQCKAQFKQQMQQMKNMIADFERDGHTRNQQSAGQGIMPSLSIGHQPLREQFEQRTDVSRHHGNDGVNRRSADSRKGIKGGPLQERRTFVSFRPPFQLSRREDNDSDLSSNASASEVSESDLTDRRSRRHGQSQRRRQTRSKQNWMKPEKFNGHGSFESFLIQFENCASYNGWSNRDKLAHLR